MLNRIEDDGICVMPVEGASRFARSLMAQELGALLMRRCGVEVSASVATT
jgi:hypothetical protein